MEWKVTVVAVLIFMETTNGVRFAGGSNSILCSLYIGPPALVSKVNVSSTTDAPQVYFTVTVRIYVDPLVADSQMEIGTFPAAHSAPHGR